MFRNKCTNCGAPALKAKFVVSKMLQQMRGVGRPDSKDKSVKDSTAAQTSTEGGKLGLIYTWLRTCFKKFKLGSLLCVSE